MGYVKMGAIQDAATMGAVYLEDQYGFVINNNSPVLPLDVNVEVLDFVDEYQWSISGSLVEGGFHPETATVPDASVSIRQHVYNQMVLLYPGLVI